MGGLGYINHIQRLVPAYFSQSAQHPAAAGSGSLVSCAAQQVTADMLCSPACTTGCLPTPQAGPGRYSKLCSWGDGELGPADVQGALPAGG